MNNVEVFRLLETAASQTLPWLSDGQIRAINELSAIIPNTLNTPVHIQATEGIGGAGKSFLLDAIKTQLSMMGVAYIDDDIDPEDYRHATGFGGPILKTGRIFGVDEHPDHIIPVLGFSVSEIDRELRQTVPNDALRNQIARTCIGSMRIAQLMADRVAELDSRTTAPAINSYLCRIAASFLYDRIPNYMLNTSQQTLITMINELYAQFIPDDGLASVSERIALELHTLVQKDFRLLHGLFSMLGIDGDKEHVSPNPVAVISEVFAQGGTFRDHPPEYGAMVTSIGQIRRKLFETFDPELNISLPLYTNIRTRELLTELTTMSLEGYSGLHIEPRISITALVPKRGTLERDILEKCLDVTIRFGLDEVLRKTAVVIFPERDEDISRGTVFEITKTRQYYDSNASDGRGTSFSRPRFTDAEGILRMIGLNGDTLVFLSGDHSKIPLVPSIMCDLILESVFQQLDIPYIVQIINKPYIYTPHDRSLEAI